MFELFMTIIGIVLKLSMPIQILASKNNLSDHTLIERGESNQLKFV